METIVRWRTGYHHLLKWASKKQKKSAAGKDVNVWIKQYRADELAEIKRTAGIGP